MKNEKNRKNIKSQDEKINVVENLTGTISTYLTLNLEGKFFRPPYSETSKDFQVFEELSTEMENEKHETI